MKKLWLLLWIFAAVGVFGAEPDAEPDADRLAAAWRENDPDKSIAVPEKEIGQAEKNYAAFFADQRNWQGKGLDRLEKDAEMRSRRALCSELVRRHFFKDFPPANVGGRDALMECYANWFSSVPRGDSNYRRYLETLTAAGLRFTGKQWSRSRFNTEHSGAIRNWQATHSPEQVFEFWRTALDFSDRLAVMIESESDAGLRGQLSRMLRDYLADIFPRDMRQDARIEPDAMLAILEKHSAILLKYAPGMFQMQRIRSLLEKGELEKVQELLRNMKLPKDFDLPNAGSPENLLNNLSNANLPVSGVNEILLEWDAQGAEIRAKIADAQSPDRIASVIRNELPGRTNRFLPTEDPDLFVGAMPEVRKSLAPWKDVYQANLRDFLAVLKAKLALDATGVEVRFNAMSLEEPPPVRSAAPESRAAVLPDDAAFASPRRVFQLGSAFFPGNLERTPASRMRRVPAFLLRHGEYTLSVNSYEIVCFHAGKLVWRTLDGDSSGQPNLLENECRAAVGGNIFAVLCRTGVNNAQTGVRAYDLNTGRVRWTWWIPNGFAADIQFWNGRFVLLASGTPFADKGCLAADSLNPCVVILLDPATGREEGRRYVFTANNPYRRPVNGRMNECLRQPMPRMTLDGPIAYLDSGIGRLAAFDLVKQEICWQRHYGIDLTPFVYPFASAMTSPPASSIGSPIVGKDVLIAAPSSSRLLFRIDKKTGRLLALRTRPAGWICGGAEPGNTLFLKTDSGLVSYDAETLKEIARLPLETPEQNSDAPEKVWTLPEFSGNDSVAVYANGRITVYGRTLNVRRSIAIPEGFLPLYGGSDRAFYLFREVEFDPAVYAVGKNAPPAAPDGGADTDAFRVELPPLDDPAAATLAGENLPNRNFNNFNYGRQAIRNFIPVRRGGRRDAVGTFYESNRNWTARYNSSGVLKIFSAEDPASLLFDPGAKAGFAVDSRNGFRVDVYELESGSLKGVWPDFDSRRNPVRAPQERNFWNVNLADGEKLYFLSALKNPARAENARQEICSIDAQGKFRVERAFAIPKDPRFDYWGVAAVGHGGERVLLWRDSQRDGKKSCAVGRMPSVSASGPEDLILTGETVFEKSVLPHPMPVFFRNLLMNDGRFVLAGSPQAGKKSLLLADLEQGKILLLTLPAVIPLPKENVRSQALSSPRSFVENGFLFLSFRAGMNNGDVRFWIAYDAATGAQIPGFVSLMEPETRGSRIYGLMPEIVYGPPPGGNQRNQRGNVNRSGSIPALRLMVYDTAEKRLLPEQRLSLPPESGKFQNYLNPWLLFSMIGIRRDEQLLFLIGAQNFTRLFELDANGNAVAFELPPFQSQLRMENFAVTNENLILPYVERFMNGMGVVPSSRLLAWRELLRLKDRKPAILPPAPAHFHSPFRCDGFADEWDERDWITLGKDRWQARLDGDSCQLVVQIRDPETVSALIEDPVLWMNSNLLFRAVRDMRIGVFFSVRVGQPVRKFVMQGNNDSRQQAKSADPITGTLTFEAEFSAPRNANDAAARVRGSFFFDLLPLNALSRSPFGTAFSPTLYFEHAR